MRIRALCAVVLGWGCTGGDDGGPVPALADPCAPVVLVPAADATDGERTAIADAAAMWGAAAATRMELAGDEVGSGAQPIPIRFASAPLAFLGAYEVERSDVVVNRDIADGQTRAIVIAHELGHAFGLAHVGGRESVMNAGNTTVRPNAGDAAELVARWGTCVE